MKQNRIFAMLLALLCVAAFSACEKRETVVSFAKGETLEEPIGNAPNFIVMDQNGDPAQLTDFAGKPVVINFWATWCTYCVQELPDFERAYAEYPDVVFMMINATDGVYETKKQADAFLEKTGYTFPVYYDLIGMAQVDYEITGYPTTVFINAQGDVVAKEVGMISYDALVQGLGLIRE